MKKILLIVFFISAFVSGQNADALFEKANTLYKENKFEEAIETYKSIEEQNLISSELYYNIGNCYYKLNQVAPTIYNYEKALLIDPKNEDAKNNLVFAKRLTIDNIEEVPKSFFQKLNKKYLQRLTYNQWAIVVVAFSFLAGLLFLAYHFSYASGKKRFFFILSVISFLLLIASLSITFNQFNLDQNTKEAIIFSEKVTVKSEPLESASEAFELHEGTKVALLDNVDDWVKIKLVDGKIGWMLQENLKVITLN